MTEEQKTKNHYEMLNNSSNKALVDLIKMQDNKIEQLKKQNKELQNGNFVLTVNEIIEGKDKKIAELEKENAELRKDLIENESDCGMCDFPKQLTKAKELLKKLLSAYTTYADSFDDRDNEIVEEAEQFLNSEVEK